MTSIEKRKLLDLIYRLVIYDLLSDTDVNKILDICDEAAERLIKKQRRASDGRDKSSFDNRRF